MLCLKCPKRDTCTELCEKAEKWVNRDYKSRRETVGLDVSKFSFSDLVGRYSGEINISYLTKPQNRCLTLFYCDGLPYWKIARNLKINKHKVKNELYSARRKIKKFYTKEKGNYDF